GRDDQRRTAGPPAAGHRPHQPDPGRGDVPDRPGREPAGRPLPGRLRRAGGRAVSPVLRRRGRAARAERLAGLQPPHTGDLLEVADLRTSFATPRGTVRAVDGVTFSLGRGRTVGIVGESGSGKTVLLRSIMGLL